MYMALGFSSIFGRMKVCILYVSESYHWWTASIKPRLLFFPCRLCFLKAFPFISFIMYIYAVNFRKQQTDRTSLPLSFSLLALVSLSASVIPAGSRVSGRLTTSRLPTNVRPRPWPSSWSTFSSSASTSILQSRQTTTCMYFNKKVNYLSL